MRYRCVRDYTVDEVLLQGNLDVLVSADRSDDGCIDVTHIGGVLDHELRVTALYTIYDVSYMRQVRCANVIFDHGELREYLYRHLKEPYFFMLISVILISGVFSMLFFIFPTALLDIKKLFL